MPQQINVTRSSMPPFEEYVEEIRPLWESRWLTNMGEKHCQLEQQLAEKLGTGRVSLFTNGHMALELLLKAMGLEGEVLTTPFTFVSTTHAICRAGLTPVFCDVKESDGTLDPAKLEERITPRTCAILPVHVYGNLCDDAALSAIAKKHGLKLIYDAAQEVKPDALINCSPCHPYFAHICDQARLHDYDYRRRDNLEDLETRARLFGIANPGTLIDTDNAGYSSRRDTMRWLLNQPKVGVPDIYSIRGVRGDFLADDDLEAIAEVWREYSARIDRMY